MALFVALFARKTHVPDKPVSECGRRGDLALEVILIVTCKDAVPIRRNRLEVAWWWWFGERNTVSACKQ